jgi:hypothetical protein
VSAAYFKEELDRYENKIKIDRHANNIHAMDIIDNGFPHFACNAE